VFIWPLFIHEHSNKKYYSWLVKYLETVMDLRHPLEMLCKQDVPLHHTPQLERLCCFNKHIFYGRTHFSIWHIVKKLIIFIIKQKWLINLGIICSLCVDFHIFGFHTQRDMATQSLRSVFLLCIWRVTCHDILWTWNKYITFYNNYCY
jgi:hypothetical protein